MRSETPKYLNKGVGESLSPGRNTTFVPKRDRFGEKCGAPRSQLIAFHDVRAESIYITPGENEFTYQSFRPSTARVSCFDYSVINNYFFKMTEKDASSAAAKKGKSPAKAKKPRTAPTHPKVSEMVNTAINSLKERSGSSLQAIKKYIASNYKVDVEKLSPFIKKYLKTSVISGGLVQSKGKGASGSFRMSSASSSGAAKSASKTKKPKAAKPKAAKATKAASSPKKTAKPKKAPQKSKPKKTPVKKSKPVAKTAVKKAKPAKTAAKKKPTKASPKKKAAPKKAKK